MTDVLYLDTDNVYRVDGVKNSQTGEFINDAVVTLTLKDADGVEIVGETWPLTLDYVAGSDGSYQAALTDALELVDGETGTAVLEIDGDSLQTTLELPIQFATRGQASLAWTSSSELYAMFGRTNVRKWADLENIANEDDISLRLQWAIDEATEEARMQLTDSPVDLPNMVSAPRPLRIAVTRLAGVFLYEARGIKDTSDEEGKHRLSSHKKAAQTFFQRVQAGQLRIDAGSTSYPVVSDDTDEDSLDDLQTGAEIFL